MQILKINAVVGMIRDLLAMLCQLIYPLISWLYTLFMNISKVNILSTDKIQPIYQRVTLIITIVMVFYVTFEFVKYVVQPDGITDKEKGVANIVYKMILVVVLIAFVPKIFTWALDLQTAIVDKGIIGKVIIGQTGNDTDKFGYTFAANTFSMFYYVEDEYKEEKCGDMTCEQLVSMNLSVLANTGKLTYLQKDLNATTKVDTGVKNEKAEIPIIEFTFNGFLAVIVGGLIAYIMAMYCIDVGVRWAQMVFLQIIAPIPIIGYLSPKKDGIFQKWCKQCLTTYLDLFIRIAIIYFMLLICSIILESRTSGFLLEGIEANGVMTTFIYIALILGVMMFAKKAPKMLQELFPSTGAASGNFGLSAKDRIEPTINAVKGVGKTIGTTWRAGKRISGAVSGAAMGLASGIRHAKAISANNGNGFTKGVSTAYSATKAAIAGAKAGGQKGGSIRKANAAARQSVQQDVSVADKGGTALGHDVLGGVYQSRAAEQDRRIESIKTVSKAKERLFTQVDELKEVKSLKKSWDAAKAAGDDDLAKTYEAQYKAAGQAARRAIIANNGTVPTTPLTYEYKDASGTVHNATYNFDGGDSVFAQAINHIANDEYRKFQGSPISNQTIDVKDPTTGRTVTKRIADLTPEEYAAYLHSIADIASVTEQQSYDEVYDKAHANANSEAPGGKK